MTQLTLDPWIPGGFMELWLEWVETQSPDYAERKLDVWKILGSVILNTAVKVVADIDPVRTGNMVVGLVGPSGSIKTWAITRIMRTCAPLLSIPTGTPEYLLQKIGDRAFGIVYETEIGTVIKQADRRSGYMRIWGDIVDKIYDLDALEAGRKRSQSVFIEPYSYYVSVCTAGTSKDYMGIFDNWPGLKRRFLMLNMGEVAPSRVWKISARGAEVLAELRALLEGLMNHMLVVRVEHPEVINEVAKREVDSKVSDPLLRRRVFDYTVKLFYALAADTALTSLLREGSVVGSQSVSVKERRRGREYELTTLSLTQPATDDGNHGVEGVVSIFKPLITRCGVKFLSVLSVDCRSWATDIQELSALLRRQLPTLPTLDAPEREYAEFVEDVRDLLKEHGFTTLRELCYRRNWVKRTALKYLETMAEAGLIVVRKKGRSTLIFNPSMKVCGTCAWFNTKACPFKGYADIGDSPEDHQCDKYTPVGEEDPVSYTHLTLPTKA